MTTYISYTSYSSQRGAALITALVILVVLTILGISAMKTASLEEGIVGNLRDHDLAFQASETGLTAAENVLNAAVTIPVPDASGGDGVYLRNQFGDYRDNLHNSAIWANGAEYGTAGTTDLAEVSSDPVFIIEYEQEVIDDLDPESKAKGKGRFYFRVTSRGVGNSPNSATMLQEIYGIRRN